MLHRIFAALFLLPTFAVAQPATPPITTTNDPAGKLLRQWWDEGTAAGNQGDWYDNRDRGHSNLDTRPYPQLQRYAYSKEDMDARRDWAAQTILRPFVCFGNSSTSAGVTTGGSNIRMYYNNPRGLEFLYAQYTRSNLYIYPEHRDHDPGHNGRGDGYGDVYPTNTPFLIASQGSSGSDQPFMHALPHVLAAFRPEVKKKLVASGMLMPTIQMILRRTYKPVETDEDYLSYKAHPTVFEGGLLQHEAMVRMAHDLRLEMLPPMVQLRVTQEETPVSGVDFFEPHSTTERLADTPVVIARVFRGTARSRKLVVSAERSGDLNNLPLKFHWVLLRGDPQRTHIRPLNDAGSVAQIEVDYQERRPIFPGSAMESNRVDIGVFVHNGSHFSAPGFVTFFFLDHEGRTYDEEGRILEMGYSMGEADLTIPNWSGFFESAKAPTLSSGMQLVKSSFTGEEWTALLKAGDEYQLLMSDVVKAQQKQKEAQAAVPKSDALLKAANAELEKSRKAADAVLDRKREGLGAPRARVYAVLEQWLSNPSFYERHRAQIPMPPRPALQRLIQFHLAQAGAELVLTPLRRGSFTGYELSLIRQFNGECVAFLFSRQIVCTSNVNYVDPMISPPKPWRDLYHYEQGKLTGWTRYEASRATEFTATGQAIVQGPAGPSPRPVRYVQPALKPGQPGPNWTPVTWSAD